MIRTEYRRRLITMAIGTALTGTMLSGCAGKVAPVASASAADAQTALAKGKSTKAVDHAEAAVLADPRNAEYRAMLGAAYLDAGRFASAATSFDDAVKLGDDSPRTALSLALALSASGKQRDAMIVLQRREDSIAPADLGLAYALAGDPRRGVGVLTQAIRSGDNTPKARQNLAYAYALAGQWREARIMAGQDIPPEKVGDRMAEWASTIQPEAGQARIAALLGVPASAADGGQPTALALNGTPDAVALAQQADDYGTPAVASPARATPSIVRAPQPIGNNGELPPVAAITSDTPPPSATARSTMLPPLATPTAATPAPSATPPVSSMRAAFNSDQGPADVRSAPRPASSAPRARTAPSAATSGNASEPAPALAAASGANGSHLVQLGSFSSEANAERAWGIYVKRYPELASREKVITQAVVRGKRYWRVSAGGYARAEATGMCGRVKSQGKGCYAWAEGRPMPGAVDTGVRMARR